MYIIIYNTDYKYFYDNIRINNMLIFVYIHLK